MPRRGDGIRKRKDGRWEARYKVATEQGNKYVSIYAPSYNEVKKKLQEVTKTREKNSAYTDTSQLKERTGLDDLIGQYLVMIQEVLQDTEKRRKYSTYIKYRTLYKNHIEPALNNGSLDATGRFSFQIGSEEDQLSVSTRRSIVTAINKMNTYIKRKEQLPLLDVQLSGALQKKEEIEVFAKEEQCRLLQCLYQDTDMNKFGIMLCLHTGIRLGELCALKWDDFDLSQGVIFIQRTVQRIAVDNETDKTKLVLSSPKSIHSERKIPLSNEILELVKKLKSDAEGYIFCRTKPLEPRTCQNRFQKLLTDADIPYKNFHVLRHTFATNCISNGVDVKTLSEILGHSDVRITLNRYVHPTMDAKRQDMNKLAGIYGQYLGQSIAQVS